MWDRNPEGDIAGYRIFWDTQPFAYPKWAAHCQDVQTVAGILDPAYARCVNGGMLADPQHPKTTITEGVTADTKYIRATAYDIAGNESALSEYAPMN